VILQNRINVNYEYFLISGRGKQKTGIFSIIDTEEKDILTRTPAGTK
jgi:hypothetical protein